MTEMNVLLIILLVDMVVLFLMIEFIAPKKRKEHQ